MLISSIKKTRHMSKVHKCPALWILEPLHGKTQCKHKHRVKVLSLCKKHVKFQLPSIKRYRSYDLQEKRGRKCQCKFECKLKHLLDSGYERDIRTYEHHILA